MKRIVFLLTILLSILFQSCSNERTNLLNLNNPEKVFTLSIAMPSDEEDTRVMLVREVGEKNIEVLWQEEDRIKLFFQQNNQIWEKEVQVKAISEDKKVATFEFTLPLDLNAGTFNLYATSGIEPKISGSKIIADVSATDFSYIGWQNKIPMMMKVENIDTNTPNISGIFSQIGSLIIVHYKDKVSPSPSLVFNEVTLDFDGEKWYYDIIDGDNPIPYLNLIDGTVEYDKGIQNDKEEATFIGSSGQKLPIVQWVMPKKINAPAIRLSVTTKDRIVKSSNSRPGRSTPMQVGKAYHLYAYWDGVNLQFSEKESQIDNVLSITTSKKPGETLELFTIYHDQNSWVDINNNGIQDADELLPNNGSKLITLTSSTVNIYGDVWCIDMKNQNITSVDLSRTNFAVYLRFSNNTLSEIIGIEKQHLLKEILIPHNKVNSLDISMLKKLEWIVCSDNNMETLTLSKEMNKLTTLDIANNNLSGTLDVSNYTRLKSISAGKNNLSTIVLGEKPDLNYFAINDNKELTGEIDLSSSSKLTDFIIENTQISQIKLPASVINLYCYDTKISGTLDLSNFTDLELLSMMNTQISKVLLPTEAPNFRQIWARNCLLSELDLSPYPKISVIDVPFNQLTSLKLPTNAENLSHVYIFNNKLDASQMNRLMQYLPIIPEGESAKVIPISEMQGEENAMPTDEDIQSALDKNWKVEKILSNGYAVDLKPQATTNRR